MLSHILGLSDPNSAWYLWWSGFFGNLPIFAGVLIYYHKHNCHKKGCPRIGKHEIDGTPYCSKHK